MWRDVLPNAKNRITAVTENSTITVVSKNAIPLFPAEILAVMMIVRQKMVIRAAQSMAHAATSIPSNAILYHWMPVKTAIRMAMVARIVAFSLVINVLAVVHPHVRCARVTIPMPIIHVAPQPQDSSVKRLPLAMVMASSIPMVTKSATMAIRFPAMDVRLLERSKPVSSAASLDSSVPLFAVMVRLLLAKTATMATVKTAMAAQIHVKQNPDIIVKRRDLPVNSIPVATAIQAQTKSVMVWKDAVIKAMASPGIVTNVIL